MLRSLMSGVSGVKSHQTMLDVTGNNIANVNTTGFKKSVTIFQDLLYQDARGASTPNEEKGYGGTNPMQVGSGVKVGAIETIHSQGNLQYTGSRNDMMIQGDGYYVLKEGTSNVYSRAGNFGLDGSSNMVQSGTGYMVQGYSMTQDPNDPTRYIQGTTLQDINIPVGQKLPAKETSLVGYRCNLDARVPSYLPTGFTLQGTTQTTTINGVEYSITFDEEGGTPVEGVGSQFMRIDFENPSTGVVTPLRLHMEGMDANGVPQLTFQETISGSLGTNIDLVSTAIAVTGLAPGSTYAVGDTLNIGANAYLIQDAVTVPASGEALFRVSPTIAAAASDGDSITIDNPGGGGGTLNAAQLLGDTNIVVDGLPVGQEYQAGDILTIAGTSYTITADVTATGLGDTFVIAAPGLIAGAPLGAAVDFASSASLDMDVSPATVGIIANLPAGTVLQAGDVVTVGTNEYVLQNSLTVPASGQAVLQVPAPLSAVGTAGDAISVIGQTEQLSGTSALFGGTDVTSYDPETGLLVIQDGPDKWELNVLDTLDLEYMSFKDPADPTRTWQVLVEFDNLQATQSGFKLWYVSSDGANREVSTFSATGTNIDTGTLNANVLVGDTSIDVDGLAAGTVFNVGDIITFAGSTQEYVITSPVTVPDPSATVTLNVSPALVAAVGAGSSLTIANPYPLFFNKDGTFRNYEASPTIPSLQLDDGNGNALNVFLQASSAGRAMEIRASDNNNPAGAPATGDAPTADVLATLNQRLTSVHATKVDIYDSLGNAHTLEVSWEKLELENPDSGKGQWRWRAWFPEDKDSFIPLSPASGVITFDENGMIKGSDVFTLEVQFAAIGADNAEIDLDFSGRSFEEEPIEGVTQFGSAFTTKAYYQDGYAMGVLQDYSVGPDGTITGVYSNEQRRPLATIALALFANPEGLQKVGDTAFRSTSNSGLAQVVSPQSGGAGKILGGNLEMSNVDLTEEFVTLIKAQRGFQANVRTVTTSDSVLEELVNIKR